MNKRYFLITIDTSNPTCRSTEKWDSELIKSALEFVSLAVESVEEMNLNEIPERKK